VLADGRLLYRFKRAWRDGTTHIVLDPLEMRKRPVYNSLDLGDRYSLVRPRDLNAEHGKNDAPERDSKPDDQWQM
jgi:hypothetical protein